MVDFWEGQLKDAIKVTKMRIKLCEKHGRGVPAMQEKSILKKQEKMLLDRRNK